MKTDYMYLCLAISIITSRFYEKLTFKTVYVYKISHAKHFQLIKL